MNRDIPPGAPRQQGPDAAALSDIRHSADLLARHHEAFTRQLHHEMTLLIPRSAVPQAFDMGAFSRQMVRTLLWAALTDQPGHVVVDGLRQAGAENWFAGFPNDEYASVAHALVQAVRYLTPDDWSTSVGSAWVSFFVWTRLHLLEGAQRAAARDAAAREIAARDAAAERAAAEREAARVAALSRRSPDGHGQVVGDVNIERVASLLDEDDDEDAGYGQIMLSMTRNPLRPRHPE